MRILFVYSIQKSVTQNKPILGQEGIYFGISSIAAVLKKHGHECRLAVLDRRYKQKNRTLLSEKIHSFNPQIIAFTAVFSEFDFICSMASQVKNRFPELFLYAGGIHITLNPDEKYLDLFNAFCIGEGEYPTLEMVECLSEGKPIDNIQNLWVKTPDGIIKNPARPFISELDELPFPERDMWQEWILEPHTKPTVLVGRGCPFNCTYCCNHALRKTGEGKYVRSRSPDNILAEIRQLYHSYPKMNEVFLEVETLGTDLQWLETFSNKLSVFNKETNNQVSFSTNLRIFPSLDLEKVFSCFNKAGIRSVTIGLESGNHRIRKEILNRNYSNEHILSAANLAKKHNIKISLYNMIGLPTETTLEFSDTLKMNQEIQPDFHATSIFFPYPGTKLYDTCKQMNLLPQSIATKDERQVATLDLPGFSKKQIQRSFDSFHYNVYKVRKNKSILKLFIYFSMKYAGHNFYANLKIFVIRLFYKLNIKNLISRDFFSIFQKSE
jgi:radical SAM superfamily enzyme YgiQ (UPF0313 family)